MRRRQAQVNSRRLRLLALERSYFSNAFGSPP
jgi:hypothetical protein